jgi:MFS family permease
MKTSVRQGNDRLLHICADSDIGPDPSYVWIALVWTLSAAVSYTLLGRLSDIFGRRWFFIGGNVLGFIGTLMGGSAKEIKTLIGANCLIGIAGAVQLSFTFVIGELVPNKHRAYANGVLYCASTPFAVFGPVIARTFILHTSAGWRWCFYLNTITTGLAIILFYFCYHPPTFEMLHTTRTKKSVFRMIDIVGVVLFTSGLVLFLLGISWGGTQYPWKSGHVIGFIVGGAVLLIIFIFYGKSSMRHL